MTQTITFELLASLGVTDEMIITDGDKPVAIIRPIVDSCCTEVELSSLS